MLKRFIVFYFRYATIMATEYGNRLRQARKHAGLNQVQLAKQTGLAQSTISSAERLGNGSTDNAVYAKACGVSAHWLETGEGEMLPATATVNITAPSPTLVATGSSSNQPIATVVPAQAAINNVSPELAEQCRSVMAMLATLPDDPVVRFQVLGQLAEIIAKARGSPPSHQESPAYSHAAIRAA